MKPIMLVNQKTYIKLKDEFEYFFEYEGQKYLILLEVESAASDGVGYLLVNGQYLGQYDLSGGGKDDGNPGNGKNYGTA